MISNSGISTLTNLTELHIIHTKYITYLHDLPITNLTIGNNILNRDLVGMNTIEKIKLNGRLQYHDIIYTLATMQNLISISAINCTMPFGTRLENLKNRLPKLKTTEEYFNTYR
jgi:hypothetical protein